MWPFAEMVAEQIDTAEARRAIHLRTLRCIRNFHGRVDVACDGLAGLVHADPCAKAKVGRNTGRHPGTHPSGETINSGPELASTSLLRAVVRTTEFCE